MLVDMSIEFNWGDDEGIQGFKYDAGKLFLNI